MQKEVQNNLFYIANSDDIKNGRTSDIYFRRTFQILKKKNKNPLVKAEVFLKSFPNNYSWGVLSGIHETLNLLNGVKGVNVSCMPEGTIFTEEEPVMVIEGRYLDFGLFETAILGFLCHSSGISTKAARCKLAAKNKLIFNFGARRVHPAITPMVERAAYIAGLDGVSTIKGAETIFEEPVGTMPHALILIFGDTLDAAQAFNETIDKNVKRIVLIDTFNDEKTEAIRICQHFSNSIYALRLDTPGSRRGNFKKILEEIRWELDIRGFKDVKLMASGGLDEQDIANLSDIVDAFGVGTSISGARVLDFSMDIVEINGKPIAKRGKKSGAKKVIRCNKCLLESKFFSSSLSKLDNKYNNDNINIKNFIPNSFLLNIDKIILENDSASFYNCKNCGKPYSELFERYIEDGRLVKNLPSVGEIRNYVLNQLSI